MPVTLFPPSDLVPLQSLPQDLALTRAQGSGGGWRLATADVTKEERGQEAG